VLKGGKDPVVLKELRIKNEKEDMLFERLVIDA
jgi:hypothetical protein